jgi:hypothetical protein
MDYRKAIRDKIKFINAYRKTNLMKEPELDENIILELRPRLFIYDDETFYKKLYERLENMADCCQMSSYMHYQLIREVINKNITCPYFSHNMINKIFMYCITADKKTSLEMNNKLDENNNDNYKYRLKYHEFTTIRLLNIRLLYTRSNGDLCSWHYYNRTLIYDTDFLDRYSNDIIDIRFLHKQYLAEDIPSPVNHIMLLDYDSDETDTDEDEITNMTDN